MARTVRGVTVLGLLLPGVASGQVGPAGPGASGGGRGPGVSVPRVATPGTRLEVPVGRVAGEVEVDAALDEADWNRAGAVELAWEVAPGDNTPAPVETVCRITHDRDNLYLGCHALDPDPGAIRAYITARDDIDGHDRVILTLDPYNDGRRAFEFGISALGVQWDAVYSAQGGGQGGGSGPTGPSDPSWDAIWSSSGRITDDGYVVEAAIPFESLRFPDVEGPQTWGFYVSRRWPRDEEVDVRSMVWDRDDACLLCQANLLTGLEDVEPGGTVRLTPTVTGSRTDARDDFPEGPMAAGSVEEEVGLDAAWRITSDLTLNATVNPDFSQVEADAPQLDVNNRFTLFFPEKRPFFLEGADLFTTPIQAVFTRTIVEPSFGVKVTGKSGASALGLLVARDQTNALTLPSSRSSTRTTLSGGVVDVLGRYRRDVGDASTVGLLVTAREGDGYTNRVGGADAFLRLGASTLQLQYLRSETEYPGELASVGDTPAGRFPGNAFAGVYRYSTRTWNAGLNASLHDRGFRADAGFVNQVDLANAWSWVGRTWWGEDDAWWTSAGLNTGFWFQRTLSDWRPIQEGVWVSASFRGPFQTLLWVNPDLARESVDGKVFEHPRLHFGGRLSPAGAVGLRFEGSVGGAVDFANAREADQIRLSPALDLRLGRRVHLRATHSFERLAHAGERVYDANVSRLRAVYNFSARAFLRGIVQYRRTDRSATLWEGEVDPESTSVATQLLFSYELNPLSVLFVGYSDSRLGGLRADGTALALTPSERTFFLKLAYAWRP